MAICATKRAKEVHSLKKEYKAAKKMLNTDICRAKETDGNSRRGYMGEAVPNGADRKKQSPSPLGNAVARKVIKDLFDTDPGKDVACRGWHETNWTQADYIEVSKELVGKAIAGLNPRRALRVDGFPVAAIRGAFRRFPGVIAGLVNLSCRKGLFPNIWKEGRLVPIPKGADGLISGYRSICVPSNRSKVLESVIREKLLVELKRVILAPNQFGFRVSPQYMPRESS